MLALIYTRLFERREEARQQGLYSHCDSTTQLKWLKYDMHMVQYIPCYEVNSNFPASNIKMAPDCGTSGAGCIKLLITFLITIL
jgi:hypothetical protein